MTSTMVDARPDARQSAGDAQELLAIATGYMASRAIYVATRLGLFDLLAAEALSAAEIAQRTESDVAAMERLLRVLLGLGLVAADDDRVFAATPRSEPLRERATPSIRERVLLFGSERTWRAWEDLGFSIASGRSAAEQRYGMNGFEYFEQHPGPAAVFRRAMAEVSVATADALVRCVDFSRVESIADIGGGDGTLIAKVLAAAPLARGVLLDLEISFLETDARLRACGVLERCRIVAGDFFVEIPAGLQLYLLKNVLHDWNDDDAARILARLAAAMEPHGRAVVVERVVDDGSAGSASHRAIALMDLNMLVTSGGRERTRREFEILFERAGLRLEGEPMPLGHGSPYSVLRVERRHVGDRKGA